MKSIVIPETGGPDVLSVRDVERPVPGRGEVLVEVDACGVNFADVEQRRGRYRGAPSVPFTPGAEVAGVVAATGPDVEDWAVGDAVFAPVRSGGYAEAVAVPAEWALQKPASLSFESAAGLAVQGFTAHNCLHEFGDLDESETVLVHAAAGGVGSLAVQIAAEAGATVLGSASTPEKREFASDLGARRCIDYTADDYDDRLADAVGERGIDLLVDGVGGQPFKTALGRLAPGGRAVVIGAASGSVGMVPTPELFYNNTSVLGYHFLRGLRDVPERILAGKRHLLELVESGGLDVQVTDVFDLGDAARAHRRIENRETRGKVVLVP